LNNVDLPTLGRPMIATVGSFAMDVLSAAPARGAIGSGKVEKVETLARPFSLGHGRKAKPPG